MADFYVENYLPVLLMFFMVTIMVVLLYRYVGDCDAKRSVHSLGPCVYGYGIADGPHTWARKFGLINRLAQSPVNIDNTSVRQEKYAQPMFVRKGFEEMPKCLDIKNTGHSVEISTHFPNGKPSITWSNALTYDLSIITFRWDSEHTIDYRQFPLEIQAIFERRPIIAKPPTDNRSSPLLIVSYLLIESMHDNPYLEPICESLDCVRMQTEAPVQLPPFPLSWLCPELQSGYYQYFGSLTFPPCSETVNWMISSRMGRIGTAQLARFKKLIDSNGNRIIHNHRPVQSLNGRVITLYQPHD